MTEASDGIPEAIKIAAEHHRAGQLRQAERIYKRILKGQPDNADALHLLGVLSHQVGKNDVAVELITKAIQSNPTKAFFFTNLATVLHMQGRLDEAIASYNRALEIEPDLADAHCNLGNSLQAQRKLDEATASYQRAIAIDPKCGEAHLGLSAILSSRGRLKEARQALKTGIRQKPLYTTNCTNQKKCLASILQLTGVQNSYLKLTKDLKTIVKSGHFHTKYVIDDKKFTVHNFYVLDHNLSDHANTLPAFDLILNSISNPDTEPDSLEEADKFISKQEKPFINNPRTVLSMSRDKVSRLLSGVENLVAPKTIRAELSDNNASSIRSILDKHGFQLPVIVRAVGLHNAVRMAKIDTDNDSIKIKISQPKQTFYFTEFHDYRSKDGYFHTMRFIFVDKQIFPDKLYVSTHWNNHAKEFTHKFMLENDWAMKEDEAFLGNYTEYIGEQNCEALRAICGKIGLDFFGIDCAIHPNGKLLLFETNPSMRVRLKEDFSHRATFTRKIKNAFGEMIIARAGKA